MSTKIERQEVIVNQFIWNENGYSLPAGELLFILTTLTRSQLETNYIGDANIANYLTSLGLIEKTGNDQYKVCPGKERIARGLGDRVSSAVDKELRKIVTVSTEVSCPKLNIIKETI